MTRLAPGSTLRLVAVPTEHGGWSITLEPVALGLLVAPSVAGLALGAGALVAFMARTPLKAVLVDRWRRRHRDRTTVAARVAAAELAVLAALAVTATLLAAGAFWWPLAAAAPLVAVELWYDMRSRGRRLVPELAGAVGIGSVAAAVALAGGEGSAVAAGLWWVVGARSVASIPFVRVQLRRAKQQAHRLWHSDLAQAAGLALALAGSLAGLVPVAAVAAVAVLALFEVVAVRRPPRPAPVLGAQQVVLGLTVVVAAALGVRAP